MRRCYLCQQPFRITELEAEAGFHVWTQKNGCSNSNRLIHLPLSVRLEVLKLWVHRFRLGPFSEVLFLAGSFTALYYYINVKPHQRSLEYHHFMFVWSAQRTAVMMLCNRNMQIDENCKIPANRKFWLIKFQFNCTTLMNNTETNVSCWGHTVGHRNVQPSIKLN